MTRDDHSDSTLPKLLTPAGGMVFSLFVGGLLWSGMAIAMHAAGAF
ncbi:MAG: hypothetical protein ACRYFW_14290 [Janthinobacterium lividum]